MSSNMKLIELLILSILMMTNNKVCAQQISAGQKKIILIDPGHGGIDSGALSKNGLQEKEILLDIALGMNTWNRSLLESKYDIYLTRNKDTLISLTDRSRLAKRLKPDIFISLHCNHIDDSSIKGIEVYVYSYNEISLLYSKMILNQLNQNLGFKTREPKEASFQILRETEGFCLSMLLELGYLSNSDESNYLTDSENRKALALAILMSI